MPLESEQLLIASCLSGSREWLRVAIDRGVTPDHFTSQEHQRLWQVILDTDQARRGVRFATVHADCLRRFPEVAPACEDLSRRGPSFQDPTYHVEAMLSERVKMAARALLADASATIMRAQTLTETQEKLRQVSSGLDALAANLPVVGQDNSFLPVFARTVSDLERLLDIQRGGKPPWITSGIGELDRVLGGGWQKPGAYVVCAMSGRGKTHLGIHFAMEAARAGAAVVYFTVEMPQVQIMRRVMANAALVRASRLSAMNLSSEELDRISAIPETHQIRLAIEDNFRAELEQVAALVRRYRREGKLDFAVLDYIQQLVPRRRLQTKQQDMLFIAHELKQLCMQEGIAMLQLAQANREAEKAERSGERLSAAHMEHSHAIYENADVALFFQSHDHARGRQDLLYVAKNRHGEGGRAIPITLDYEHSRVNAYESR